MGNHLLLLFLIFVLLNVAVDSKCFRSGIRSQIERQPNRTIFVMDGINGTCIVANSAQATYQNASEICNRDFFYGELMTAENRVYFKKSSYITSYLDFWKMWVASPLEAGNCTVITPEGYITYEGCENAGFYFICQYPFQHQCSYRTEISDGIKDDGFIASTNVKQCKANVTTYWRQSDADHKKVCSINIDQVYGNLSQGNFCDCVKEKGWKKTWENWAACDPCDSNKRISKRYRWPHEDCFQQLQWEERTCNSNVTCTTKMTGQFNVSMKAPHRSNGTGKAVIYCAVISSILGSLCVMVVIIIWFVIHCNKSVNNI